MLRGLPLRAAGCGAASMASVGLVHLYATIAFAAVIGIMLCMLKILAVVAHSQMAPRPMYLKPDKFLMFMVPGSGQLVAKIGDLGSLSITHGVGAMTRPV